MFDRWRDESLFREVEVKTGQEDGEGEEGQEEAPWAGCLISPAVFCGVESFQEEGDDEGSVTTVGEDDNGGGHPGKEMRVG